jgi:hypothetical protein
MTADDPPHGTVTSKTVGIVYVFIATEPPENRLTKQSHHPVLTVPANSRIEKPITGGFGQSKGIIEFPKRKQARIRCDLRAVKAELQSAIKTKPKNPRFSFTHRVSHQKSSSAIPIH